MEKGLGGYKPKGFDTFEVTLGDEMRGERATLGKSLLDVQRDLRIKATYLAAIENCDPSVFQTPGFIAGYVRSYARYLEMDPEECFFRFCEQSGFNGVHADLKGAPSLAAKSASLLQTPITQTNLDPITNPRVPISAPSEGLLERLSLAGFGSIAVLLALVLGLGYGGWSVLQEVQRVQFVPVNQTPEVSTQADVLASDGPGLEDGTANFGAPRGQMATTSLDQLYRPQALEVPQLIARDGPILSIDPNSQGVFASQEQDVVPTLVAEAPKVIKEAPPPMDIVALKPAWIRIYYPDGSVLFEQTLNAGERYRLPDGVVPPLLRAGNASAVFVNVGQKTYGPLTRSGSVVRNVSLDRDDVTSKLALVNDVFNFELAPPIIGDAGSYTAQIDADIPQE